MWLYFEYFDYFIYSWFFLHFMEMSPSCFYYPSGHFVFTYLLVYLFRLILIRGFARFRSIGQLDFFKAIVYINSGQNNRFSWRAFTCAQHLLINHIIRWPWTRCLYWYHLHHCSNWYRSYQHLDELWTRVFFKTAVSVNHYVRPYVEYR